MNILQSACNIRWQLVLLLTVCALLRFAVWPAENEMRDIDAVSYLQSGLQAVEGMQPAMRHCPGGPQTWLTMVCAATLTAWEVVVPGTPQEGGGILRVIGAMDRVLFRLYHDSQGLLQIHLIANLLLALCTTAALWRWGLEKAGETGALVLPCLYLFTPVLLRYALLPNPYFAGWSLALLAFALMENTPRRAAICFGLAVASRLELAALLPFLVLEMRGGLRGGMRFGVQTLATFALAAPWFLAGLASGLRNAISIGLFRSGNAATPVGAGLWMASLVTEGWLLWMVPAALALCLRNIRWQMRLSISLLLVLLLFVPLRESRYSVVWVLGLAPAVVAALARFRSVPWISKTARILLLPAAIPILMSVQQLRQDRVADTSVEWMEQYLAPGTPVFLIPSYLTPLPTSAASTRLWDAVRRTDAWRQKLKESSGRIGFDAARWPRALTEEPLNLDLTIRRRWWILGSPHKPSVPRFELVLQDSLAFGVLDLPAAWQQKGGCLVVRGLPRADLGEPALALQSRSGRGVFLYVRPALP